MFPKAEIDVESLPKKGVYAQLAEQSKHINFDRRFFEILLPPKDRLEVYLEVVEAYSDADFAADTTTSRSTSGSLIRLASGPIFWKSRLQKEVVLSTTEAEYLAATETCRQLQWTKALFQELDLTNLIEGSECTNLYVDNQSAISLIKNHDNHKRSKHIALRNHYCREQHQNGLIAVTYIPSAEQLSDPLTKIKSQVTIH
ncbi:hypothetical protein K3495_g12234 [Podosphaera aphanis]|nr:hypothetical protein K3495_g12234 [Podosphaera aphanis]